MDKNCGENIASKIKSERQFVKSGKAKTNEIKKEKVVKSGKETKENFKSEKKKTRKQQNGRNLKRLTNV
jgi:hypothetical protein